MIWPVNRQWRDVHKLAPVRISTVMAALFGLGPILLDAWSAVPDDLRNALPHGWGRVIATSGFVLVVLAHLFVPTERPPVEEVRDASH